MKKYNVLLIGSGGREHALALKISQSPLLQNFYAFPGNPGMASVAECIPGKPTDFQEIKRIVEEKSVDLVVVGPEDPLAAGLKDYLEENLVSVPLFVGPGKDGARLEGSKDFAKEFMVRHNIPTAAYRTFTGEDSEGAKAFLKTLKPPYVLKADGLAAGKGVLILDTEAEACAALDEMFGGRFGDAGSKVVIEEFLTGTEVSFFVITDGKDWVLLPEAKDYKRALDGDEGLNTGGMGSVSPVPFATSGFRKKVEDRIIRPTVEGLRAEGVDYRGFIFFGLMDCGGDPYVIEYNVRMGDPETESVMARIESDLLEVLVAAAEGNLSGKEVKISPYAALTAVIVSGGYPGDYRKGMEIHGTDNVADGMIVHHAGTAIKDGRLVTSGGRVLALTVLGRTLKEARERIYSNIDGISFEGSFRRSDIGKDMVEIEDRDLNEEL